MKIKVVLNSNINAFGGYLSGSLKDGEALVAINLDGFFQCIKDGDIRAKEFPKHLAVVVAHEVIHAIEDWAGVEFSERRVNAILKKAEAVK